MYPRGSTLEGVLMKRLRKWNVYLMLTNTEGDEELATAVVTVDAFDDGDAQSRVYQLLATVNFDIAEIEPA